MIKSGSQSAHRTIVNGRALFFRLLAVLCPMAVITTYSATYGAWHSLRIDTLFELPSSLYGAALAVALSARRKLNAITGLQILVVALVTGVPSVGNTWDPVMVFFASLCAGGVAASRLSLPLSAKRPYVRPAVCVGYRIARTFVAGALCYAALTMPWARAGGGEQFITRDVAAFASVTYSVVVGVLAFDLVVDLFVRKVAHCDAEKR